MSTTLPAKSQFPAVPAGSHLALCYGVIDLGTQVFKSAQYGDETCGGIVLQFEFPDELMDDGRPFALSKTFKMKSGKKAAFRKFLEAWRGVPFTEADFGKFDAVKLLGKPALISIVHDTTERGTYANISTIMQPMKGVTIPQPFNKLTHIDLDKFDQAAYDGLTDWLKNKIALSTEYQKLKGTAVVDEAKKVFPGSEVSKGALDDEIPF